ncbi:MAG TPA: diguanylate cyclase [Rhodocyclaceae bacterium]|nr:diguanylate cyclase [Rhodocyclaceae bacterium]
MSELFKWSPAFLTHLAEVDAQHRRLVDLINHLGSLLTEGQNVSPAEIDDARSALIAYGNTHFLDEETMFTSVGVDARHVEFHRAEHQSFIDELQGLGWTETANLAERERTVRREVSYLVNWLAYHILGVDQAMARQVRMIERGLDPREAFDADLAQRQSEVSTEPLLVALNGLLATLSERNRELAAVNRTLEQRVIERTAELERANARLHILTYEDELTGLPNRRHAVAALEALWKEARRDGTPLSVLLLDADRFKGVNDTFGHAEGDAVLKALGQRLRDSVRTSDIVCRLGGDEFLVICPRSDRAGAAHVAGKVIASRRAHINAAGQECWSGAVSVGVAEVEPDMRSAEDVLKAADRALYAAKRSGGDRVA